MKDVITILLPALNEEEGVPQVLAKLPREYFLERGYDTEVLVVDGHSTDRTLEIAAEMGAICLRQPHYGKGDAVRHGMKHAKGKYLFMLDADDTYPPKHLSTMLPILEDNKADIVMGSRLNGHMHPGSMPKINKIGNHTITSFANLLFSNGHKITDLCTGMWGFNKSALDTLTPQLNAHGFAIEAEMYAKSRKQGIRVAEIPIEYHRRLGPTKLTSFGDGARIMMKLLGEKL